jgi:lipid-A-disaccharide synthase
MEQEEQTPITHRQIYTQINKNTGKIEGQREDSFMKKIPCVMILAGDISGDRHGYYIIKALKEYIPDIEIFGCGGSLMEEAGMEVIAKTAHLSSVGLVESFQYLPKLSKIFKQIKDLIQDRKPDLLLLIDNQGFNIQVAKAARSTNIPILYYFAPQIWLWGGWRAKYLAKLFTHVLATFKPEEECYRKLGANVTFVGHPFVDTVKPSMTREEAFNAFGLDPQIPVIGLLPGSRKKEIECHLPIVKQVAKRLSEKGKFQFLLPIASKEFEKEIQGFVEGTGIVTTLHNPYDAINICELIITASGTVTLEAACLGVPMVIFYRTSLSTWILANLLVKYPFIGMPNILANRQIVPEFIQFQATPEKICNEALSILQDQERRLKIKEELKEIASKLGEKGAVKRATNIIINYLKYESKGKST